MPRRRSLVLAAALVALALVAGVLGFRTRIFPSFAVRVVHPGRERITMHLRDPQGQPYGNLGALLRSEQAQGRAVRFAMNGGMYDPRMEPVGLYVEEGRTLTPLDARRDQPGNFYLMPNGVFGVTRDDRAFVVTTESYGARDDVRIATQSGPMLVVHGAINPLFRRWSSNLNVRNGVGVRANGEVVFVLSRDEVNFYALARHFVQLGCTDALYLDGHVSRAYIPEEGVDQREGRLGVLIAVSVPARR